MGPEAAAAAEQIFYGIIKSPTAMDNIKKLPSRLRDKINDAIDTLQMDPRPPEHKPLGGLGVPILSLMVDSEYSLQYQVDDNTQRVFIILVTRFS